MTKIKLIESSIDMEYIMYNVVQVKLLNTVNAKMYNTDN